MRPLQGPRSDRSRRRVAPTLGSPNPRGNFSHRCSRRDGQRRRAHCRGRRLAAGSGRVRGQDPAGRPGGDPAPRALPAFPGYRPDRNRPCRRRRDDARQHLGRDTHQEGHFDPCRCRAGAFGPGRRHGIGRQHRRRDGHGRQGHGPHPRGQAPGRGTDLPDRPRRAHAVARRRRERGLYADHAGAVRGDGRGLHPGAFRVRAAADRAAIHRRGRPQGQRPDQQGEQPVQAEAVQLRRKRRRARPIHRATST